MAKAQAKPIIIRPLMPRPTPFLIPLLSLCSITCVAQRQARGEQPAPCPSQRQLATSPAAPALPGSPLARGNVDMAMGKPPVSNSPCLTQKGGPPCPSEQQPLTGPSGALRESQLPTSGNIQVDADQAVANMLDWTVHLQGNVDMKQGVRELKSEELDYNRKTNAVKSDKRLEYSDPLIHLIGNKGGSYSPDKGGDFKGAEFDLRQRSAHGTADSMHWSPQGVLTMKRVTFSTCPANRPSWKIKARRVTLDTQSKVGSASGATIDFQGVPIMYLPALSFPLSNERKSGFLFPVIGDTSQSGAVLSTPFYWNIAPNLDFTLQPTEYSRRNEDIGGDFRYLTDSSHGELIWDYLPNDVLYQKQYAPQSDERSRVRFTDATELPGDFRLSLQGDNVSDSHYFEDFSQGPEGSATAFLDRAADLSYRDEHWRFDGEAEEYETVDATLPLEERPYERVPRVGLSGDFGFGPGELLRYGFDSEAVRFDRDDTRLTAFPSLSTSAALCAQIALGCRVTGWRFNVTPQASLNLGGPGYFVHPTVGYSATQYELENVPSLYSSTPQTLLPFGSFDTGLVLEKDLQSERTLTLEPRLMYLYVPYRDQSKLPLFDTGVPDLNPIELFRPNRYVGGDRFGDANELTGALSSRLFDSGNGQQFLSATVGESYYFVPPRVTIPGEAPLVGRSDFIAQLQLTAFEHWSANYGLQWNPHTDTAVREYVDLQYKPASTAVVNLAWRFEQNSVDQVEFSTAWPVTHSWNIFLREIYSLRSETYFLPLGGTTMNPTPVPINALGQPAAAAIPVTIPPKPLETFVGFEYRSCCWAVRIGARQYVNAFNGSQATGEFLELELMGFASGLGNAPDTVLMENIRGYVPPNARIPPNFVPPAFP